MAKKISAGIGLDGEKEFRQAVKAINSDLNVLKSEMKLVTAEFIDNEDSIKSLKAQQEVLNKQINEHSEKCNILKSALQNATKAYQENVALLPKMEKNLNSARNEYERIAKAFGKNSDEAKAAKRALDSAQKSYDDVSKATQHARSQMNHWQKALNETTADIHKMKKNLDDLEDKSKVINRLKSTFDSLTDKIDDAKEKTEKFRDGLDKIGDAAKKGVKVATGAITVAGGAIVALTKNAVENYAEYEQLIGGVETLFGAGGQSLSEYAKANNATWAEVKKDYDLLIQSQQDVIDNANVAYKTAGISANEYMTTVTSFSASLLQSLEGDTVKAAEKADQALIDMSDTANKMGSDMQSIQNAYQGFAKQNYTMLDNLKLGYGGTKEEMERLLDDAAKLDKAFAKQFKDSGYDMSFSNVVDAIHIIQSEMGITGTTAKEASTTITGSISSMQASWQNLLTGIADENQNTDDLIDYFVDSVVTVGENVTPVVEESLKGIGDLIEGLAPVIVNDLLPSVMNDVLPDIAKNATEIISTLTKGLSENKEGVINSAVKIITELGTGLIGCAPDIIDVGMDLIIGLIDGLTSPESMEKLIGGAIECIGKITSTLIEKIPDILAIGGQIIEGLWNGIKDKDGWLREKISSFFGGVKQSIKDFFGIASPSKWARYEIMGNVMDSFGLAIDENADKVRNKMTAFTATLTEDVEYDLRISDINAQIASADIPASVLTVTHTQPAPSNDDKFDRMLALLEIIAMNSKKDLLIDKKTLVGELVPEINEELGDILVKQERGS
ncbi:MAG: hypothetical protein IKM66_06775 [Clostridia bacterium]|nr:hypothetical protein [Clostridia bacterium]